MKKLSMADLGRLSPEDFREADKQPVVLILDNIRSMHNVGSAFRTSDAFRISKIYLTGITATPPHREIHKTALGATDTVEWEYVESPALCARQLQEQGYTLIAIEQTSESHSLEQFRFDAFPKVALIFGNEVDGVSEEVLELADRALEIPQHGTKHSLNVSVCLGIVVWRCFEQFILKK